MYAIAHIVYGTYVPSDLSVNVPIEELADIMKEEGLDETEIETEYRLADWISDGDVEPFEINYRGGADHGIYAGIKIDEFDEVCDAIDIATLKLSPTSEQYDEARAKIAMIPEWMREHLPPIGTYIVWSSS